MKKLFFALVMLTTTMAVHAMSYEQARNEALFLTDKMAYELNLTDEQYEAAYEINLDYLMGVTGRSDVFGTYWERRNLDLSYILFDWQWNAYMAASYFYRPLYWEAGFPTSMPPIAEATPGTFTEATATIMAAETTTALCVGSTTACTTAGTAETSVRPLITVPPA